MELTIALVLSKGYVLSTRVCGRTCVALQWRNNGHDCVSNHQLYDCIQAQIKENTKTPRHWPLCGEFTGTGTKGQDAENISIWWRHHGKWRLICTGSHSIVVCSGSEHVDLPISSGLCHWQWGNHTIAPVPMKQPWRIWISDMDM